MRFSFHLKQHYCEVAARLLLNMVVVLRVMCTYLVKTAY